MPILESKQDCAAISHQKTLLLALDKSLEKIGQQPNRIATKNPSNSKSNIHSDQLLMGIAESQEYVDSKPKIKDRRQKCVLCLKDNLLLILLVFSIFIGIGLGAAVRGKVAPDDERTLSFLWFPGELLMRMLKMLILPLIMSSLVSGVANLDSTVSGKLGIRAVVYYMSTTVLAIILGIFLVLTIRPGAGAEHSVLPKSSRVIDKTDPIDSLLDLIRNLFPDNIVVAAFRSTRTILVPKENSLNSTDNDENATITYVPKTRVEEGSNVLGLVFFSLLLGAVVSRMGPSGKPIADLFECLAKAVMMMINLVIWYSPIGIIFLIMVEIIKMPDIGLALRQLGLYIVTVISGLLIHGFVVLPLIYLIITRSNPITYTKGMLQAMATAFGTASSAATLPITFHCLENKNGVDPRVTRFVLPVGATINMDGTALYEAVAPIFIAQLNNIPLSASSVAIISITATCASIGAASIPQAGLVTMVIVLTSVGLPIEDIARILAVDWFLDRFRTMINVLGDSFGAGIVQHLSKKDLSIDAPLPNQVDSNNHLPTTLTQSEVTVL